MTLFGNNAVDITQPSETPPAIYLQEEISFMTHRNGPRSLTKSC